MFAPPAEPAANKLFEGPALFVAGTGIHLRVLHIRIDGVVPKAGGVVRSTR